MAGWEKHAGEELGGAEGDGSGEASGVEMGGPQVSDGGVNTPRGLAHVGTNRQGPCAVLVWWGQEGEGRERERRHTHAPQSASLQVGCLHV